jgi:tRNA dimethylallyltransferase
MCASETPIVLVGGPTASGKSALALAVAEEFRGTVINADSMQIYRDLSVVTARPRATEEARAPHRLYGVLDAAETCSAARWRALADREIEAAQGEGRLPVLTGGTGLYFRALLEGLAPVPEIPAEIREAARALYRELGASQFHARLAEHDAAAAARLPASDTQRVIRAYEVVVATGRSLMEWQRAGSASAHRVAAAILLLPPREVLYPAIDHRVEAMAAAGAIEEVRRLLARDLPSDVPALKAVGVPEFAAHVRGELTLADAVAAAQQATRRYAKRQMTWLRHQMPPPERLPALRVAAQFSESLLPEIFSFIRQFVLTGSPQAV